MSWSCVTLQTSGGLSTFIKSIYFYLQSWLSTLRYVPTFLSISTFRSICMTVVEIRAQRPIICTMYHAQRRHRLYISYTPPMHQVHLHSYFGGPPGLIPLTSCPSGCAPSFSKPSKIVFFLFSMTRLCLKYETCSSKLAIRPSNTPSLLTQLLAHSRFRSSSCCPHLAAASSLFVMLSTIPLWSRQAKKASRAAQHLSRAERPGAMYAPSEVLAGGGGCGSEENQPIAIRVAEVIGGRRGVDDSNSIAPQARRNDGQSLRRCTSSRLAGTLTGLGRRKKVTPKASPNPLRHCGAPGLGTEPTPLSPIC